jgi:hypothetical protein
MHGSIAIRSGFRSHQYLKGRALHGLLGTHQSPQAVLSATEGKVQPDLICLHNSVNIYEVFSISVSALYYYYYKRTTLFITDPKFYEDVSWLKGDWGRED